MALRVALSEVIAIVDTCKGGDCMTEESLISHQAIGALGSAASCKAEVFAVAERVSLSRGSDSARYVDGCAANLVPKSVPDSTELSGTPWT